MPQNLNMELKYKFIKSCYISLFKHQSLVHCTSSIRHIFWFYTKKWRKYLSHMSFLSHVCHKSPKQQRKQISWQDCKTANHFGCHCHWNWYLISIDQEQTQSRPEMGKCCNHRQEPLQYPIVVDDFIMRCRMNKLSCPGLRGKWERETEIGSSFHISS